VVFLTEKPLYDDHVACAVIAYFHIGLMADCDSRRRWVCTVSIVELGGYLSHFSTLATAWGSCEIQAAAWRQSITTTNFYQKLFGS